jgi:chemotaxis protein CheZ
LDKLVAQVTQSVVDGLDSVLAGVIQKEVSQVLAASLSRALKEGEFFRRVNEDMREGLEKIYGEIREARREAGQRPRGENETGELISEASDQLDAILRSTEEATVRIMDIVEQHQEMVTASGELLAAFRTAAPARTPWRSSSARTTPIRPTDEIMTALSFQDLTGQRIKKITRP